MNQPPALNNRHIRVFISSTFQDMKEERDELMAQVWPELRRRSAERGIEFTEVDLRWGISETQSQRKETLKLCLDEINSCRPFFIGLLGERYGWVPGHDSFSPDVEEEQPWIRGLRAKSVTELEILHGVINNPHMASRSYFYFRDPEYANIRGGRFHAADSAETQKQSALKSLVRETCKARGLPLRPNYRDPRQLAAIVFEDLSRAIDELYPEVQEVDALKSEATAHETFAETRRRTYIGDPVLFETLDRHALSNSGPLVVLGEPGGGKTSLLANWFARWREDHPQDLCIQHYIGGPADSADHVRLVARISNEIRKWVEDPEEVPRNPDALIREFPSWLAKADIKARRDGLRVIVVMDALEQLENRGHAHQLGWLSPGPLNGTVRVFLSTLPGETLDRTTERSWPSILVRPLSVDGRRKMIRHYLRRFGKTLDAPRLERIAGTPATANPLYLKTVLDELRVTGTHERLDERLDEYLAATDILALTRMLLARYEADYDRDRNALVREALSYIWASRRGLSERELLDLLKAEDLPQLPAAYWAPIRAALDEALVDRDGVLNFSHTFFREAVATAFVPDQVTRKTFLGRLADFLERSPLTGRNCDELPWIYRQLGDNARLRACLLDFERFQLFNTRNQDELVSCWLHICDEQQIGAIYLESFEKWAAWPLRQKPLIGAVAYDLAHFLSRLRRQKEIEPLLQRALSVSEELYGPDDLTVAMGLNGLALFYKKSDRLVEAEQLYRRALGIAEQSTDVNRECLHLVRANLAQLLDVTNRKEEAERLTREALKDLIRDFGEGHPHVAVCHNNLSRILLDRDQLDEAKAHSLRALAIDSERLGPAHPQTAKRRVALADVLCAAGRLDEAVILAEEALTYQERALDNHHPPLTVTLNNLAMMLKDCGRLGESEEMLRRALAIDEAVYGSECTIVALRHGNLAVVLHDKGLSDEAEQHFRRAIEIGTSTEGPTHPDVAHLRRRLAALLVDVGRLEEAEAEMSTALEAYQQAYGESHETIAVTLAELAGFIHRAGRVPEAISMLRRSLAISGTPSANDDPESAVATSNLAAWLYEVGQEEEVESLVRKSLKVLQNAPFRYRKDYAKTLRNFAVILDAKGRREEAEVQIREAIAVYDGVRTGVAAETSESMKILVSIFWATGRMDATEPLILRIIEIDGELFGNEHPSLLVTLDRLISVLKNGRRFEDAVSVAERTIAIAMRHRADTGEEHPRTDRFLKDFVMLSILTGRRAEEIKVRLDAMAASCGLRLRD